MNITEECPCGAVLQIDDDHEAETWRKFVREWRENHRCDKPPKLSIVP